MPNRVRFDGRARRFYEVWYWIFVDRASGDGFWIRYTLLNPLDPDPRAGGGLWFAHTSRADPTQSFAVHHAVPFAECAAPPRGTEVGIGSARLAEGALEGGLEAGGHAVSWRLAYEPSPEPHYFFGPFLRRVTARRTSVTIPNPRIHLSGTVTIDGRAIDIQGAPGHQAHHWGVERAPRWIWGHCSAFAEDDRAVLELLAAEAPTGHLVTFVNLHTAERSLLCATPSSLLANRAAAGLGFWHFEARSGDRTILADVTADPERVLRFVYTSTAYRASECWNTQTGDCLVRVYRGGSLETVLRAHGTAAAEVHDEDPSRLAYPAWG